ncbi:MULTISPECIES: TetR/AcrR family transcriptional regulator [unclassified Streptomyces]|uniref:TetR/AcrR family transcriptional regulator n=1 Tax=unclassified Streptomyces TaxID=2593676 RepID=UPI00224D58C4|nr:MULTISPECIES: TetR/AcrR family transcriptional regulator [unclassified Streptomyces]MCX5142083.1 TetR/AcrR family transcriptional regulator [Streptomyces sp. NBC_00338]WRZ66541.1 TetR/AcrR family transcriptional regulator [Streptomyces sp. NBC_01257]
MKDQGSLRERLVDVGAELVAAEGPAALGLREIARRAGVSHGAPRRYFPTHHALLSAIAQRGFQELRARFEAALAESGPARTRLGAVARAYVRYALECRGMYELMFRHDLLEGPPQAPDRPRLRESSLPLFERMTGLVAQCRAEAATGGRGEPGGSAAPDDDDDGGAAVVAAALWSNLHGVAQLWAWGSLPLALDATLPPSGPAEAEGDDPAGRRLERLVTAVVDAHLGPASP